MFGFGKKGALKDFLNDTSAAIVHIYADAVKIDGRSADELDHMKGENGELVVKLSAGIHTILGTHRTTNLSFKFKTEPTESEVSLENGHEYTFGLYEYSRAVLEANKDNPKMRYVYYLPMEGAGKEFGIVCFLDK